MQISVVGRRNSKGNKSQSKSLVKSSLNGSLNALSLCRQSVGNNDKFRWAAENHEPCILAMLQE